MNKKSELELKILASFSFQLAIRKMVISLAGASLLGNFGKMEENYVNQIH